MASANLALTPLEAAAAIAEEQHYEERTTARTAGLIAMVWAIIIPMTLLVQLSFDLYLFRRAPWVDMFLWLPPAVAGTTISMLLARDRAIRFGLPFRSRDSWLALGTFIVSLFAWVGLVAMIKVVHADAAFTAITFTTVAGAYLATRGFWLLRKPWCRRPWTLLIGLGLLATGIMYGLAGLGMGGAPQWTQLVQAGTIGVAWFAHGLLLYLRG